MHRNNTRVEHFGNPIYYSNTSIAQNQPQKREFWLKRIVKNYLWGLAVLGLACLFYNRKDRRSAIALLIAEGMVGAARSGKPVSSQIRRYYL